MGKSYGDLKIEGVTANAALDCMRNEGVMPSQPAYEGAQKSKVEVTNAGQVTVTEFDPTSPNSGPMTVFTPASDGNPAEAVSLDVKAVGSAADTMSQKARACALKSIGAGP